MSISPGVVAGDDAGARMICLRSMGPPHPASPGPLRSAPVARAGDRHQPGPRPTGAELRLPRTARHLEPGLPALPHLPAIPEGVVDLPLRDPPRPLARRL